MPLSKIVQESVESVNIKFTAWNSQQDKEKAELLTMMWEPVNAKFKEYLISSQISLLEAVEAMLKEEYEEGIYMYEPALTHVSEKIQEQIEECKKLLK